MNKRKSETWIHFSKIQKDLAQCNNCGAHLSCKGGNTTGLINHLKLHNVSININASKSCEVNDEATSSKQFKSSASLISNFLKKESLNEILSKCAAKDGFSFNSIVHSEAIKGYVASRHHNMPKSCNTVREKILEFFEEKKLETKSELQKLIQLKKKFSISIDEWTDVAMRRYLNVTLRSSHLQFVLGLITIKEKCTAEKIKELVKNTLDTFGVNLEKDIVASTNDGASAMIKYCSLITAETQLCYNHAIHLAVLKVMYKNIDNFDNEKSDDENDDLHEDEVYEQENENLVFFVEKLESNVLISNIKLAIYEMRKVVKFFRNSSIRTKVLLKYVEEQEGHELKLLLDVPTRWNSLALSINRFLLLINCINNALDELGIQKFSEDLINILKNISVTLEPIMLAVEELSKDDANLLTAEGTILYVFQRLKTINTDISKKLLETLKSEIEKRRNKDLITLLYFLHHGSFPKQFENEFLSYSSKNVAKNLAKHLFQRLFLEEISNHNAEESEIEIYDASEETEHHNLQKSIGILTTLKKLKCVFDINTEFKFIKGNNGKRSTNMDNLYEALLSVSPTSTSSERTFSAAGNTVNKIRSRLGTNTVNALVYLRYYFMKYN